MPEQTAGGHGSPPCPDQLQDSRDGEVDPGCLFPGWRRWKISQAVEMVDLHAAFHLIQALVESLLFSPQILSPPAD